MFFIIKQIKPLTLLTKYNRKLYNKDDHGGEIPPKRVIRDKLQGKIQPGVVKCPNE